MTVSIRNVIDSTYWNAPVGTPITPAMNAAKKVEQAAKKAKGSGSSSSKPKSKTGSSKSPSSLGAATTGPKKGIPKDRPAYKKRMAEYDAAIKGAKSEPALQKVISRMSRDQIIQQDDYSKLLDRVEAKGVEVGALSKPAAKKPDAPKAPEKPQTVKPKVPPGAAAQRAREAAPDKTKPGMLSRLKDRIAGRPRADEVQTAKEPKKPESPKAAAPSKKPQAPDTKPAPAPKKAPKRPLGADPVGHKQDREGMAAQAAHFTDPKNGIGDAPAEGLWDHILTDPRFDLKENGSPGNAINFWVTDNGKVPPETWMFKSTFFDGVSNPDGFTEERMHDAMASEMLNAFGMGGASTRFASTPQGVPGMIAQRNWVEEHTDGGKIVPHLDVNSSGTAFTNDIFAVHPKAATKGHATQVFEFSDDAVDRIRSGPKPEALVDMALFDYVTNNAMDRHGANLLAVEHKDGGLEIAMIDHGMAFGCIEDSEQIDTKQITFDEFVDGLNYRPDDLTADGGFDIFGGISRVAQDRDTLVAQIEKSLAKLNAFQVTEIKKKVGSNNLTKNQKKYMAEWLSETDDRITWLFDNVDFVADYMLQKGNR